VLIYIPYGIGGSCTDEITFSVFQSFGTTAGLQNRETKARLVHAFYRPSGMDRITKDRVLKKGHVLQLHACKCENKQNFPGFIVFFPNKKRSLPLDCTPAYRKQDFPAL